MGLSISVSNRGRVGCQPLVSSCSLFNALDLCGGSAGVPTVPGSGGGGTGGRGTPVLSGDAGTGGAGNGSNPSDQIGGTSGGVAGAGLSGAGVAGDGGVAGVSGGQAGGADGGNAGGFSGNGPSVGGSGPQAGDVAVGGPDLSTFDFTVNVEDMPLPNIPSGYDVVLDWDLRTLPVIPGDGDITGGYFDGGWTVTGPDDQVVLDLGKPISDGKLQIQIDSVAPLPVISEDLNWVGLHEAPQLSQFYGQGDMDIFYLRTLATYGSFVSVRLFTAVNDERIWHRNVGNYGWWADNDRFPRNMTLEWGANGVAYIDENKVVRCRGNICRDGRVNMLRYLFLGRDNYKPEVQQFMRGCGFAGYAFSNDDDEYL